MVARVEGRENEQAEQRVYRAVKLLRVTLQ